MQTTTRIIAGTNAPLEVTLVNQNSPTQTDGVVLTGCHDFTASAIPMAGGAAIPLSAVIVNAATGRVAISYATASFPTAGTYQVRIRFQNGSGNTIEYPADGSLRLQVVT